MSKTEKKPTKLATTAFLIIIATSTEIPGFFKYPMLAIAAVSLILGIIQYHKEWKTNQLS